MPFDDNKKGTNMSDVIKVLLNSIFSFVYLFIIAKLLGKKQVAQITVVDYVVGISFKT